MKRRIITLFIALFLLLPLVPHSLASSGVPYKGVDVSSWQGDIDWSKMKAAGIDFAILRCYSSKADGRFAEYYSGAKAQGIWVGSYVYMYATTAGGAVSEANGALSALGGRSLDFPFFLDVEDERLKDLGKQALTDLVISELEIFAAAGYRVGIYASQSFSKNYIDMSRLSGYDFWCAKWTMHASGNTSGPFLIEEQDPYEKNPGCHVWQCSNGGDGSVYGTASRFVDLDYCYYDYARGGRSIYPYTSPDPDDYAVPKRDITYASGQTTVGCDAAWVQTVLSRLGYPLDVDGTFGPASSAAVKQFQTVRGLSVTGNVDAVTRISMIAAWDNMRKGLLKVSFDTDRSVRFYTAGDPVALPQVYRDGYFLYGWKVVRTTDGARLTNEGFSASPGAAAALVQPEGYAATSVSWLSGSRTDLTFCAVWIKNVPGDADGDGEVTMRDVLMMRRYVAGLDDNAEMIMRLADSDGSGSVSAKDILIARRIVAGLT